MKRLVTAVLVTGALAMAASPASAMHKEGHTPGPKADHAAKAKAYGKFCQGQSKKHVKGTKGTPFSNCVNAMAKVAKDDMLKPKDACKPLSKKHVKGEKGTPFSRCVVAANELRRELAEEAAENETI
ncbi:MAG TPA: hypothetical protein VMF31_03035 [Solirubrobacterales bacterium]|nr:hypothetical protein [Solirubrobacterales bacterium]